MNSALTTSSTCSVRWIATCSAPQRIWSLKSPSAAEEIADVLAQAVGERGEHQAGAGGHLECAGVRRCLADLVAATR